MARKLKNSVVVITGASAGIGEALARELSAVGARLVLAARRAERLHALNEELGARHLVVPTDVADADQCRHLIDAAVSHYGRIDTLVCNAGYGVAAPMERASSEEVEQIFRTNVFGTLDCIRPAIPIMRQQDPTGGYRGQILIVSSAAARRGLPYFGTYSATKAAQLSLAESLRVELRTLRIAVTSVHPIGTDTDFFKTAESLGHTKMPDRSPMEIHQSPRTVARAMMRGMRRPRPEIWPFPPARYGLVAAVLLPRLVDWVMSHFRQQLAKQQQQP